MAVGAKDATAIVFKKLRRLNGTVTAPFYYAPREGSDVLSQGKGRETG
jgi:hypothetical protein